MVNYKVYAPGKVTAFTTNNVSPSPEKTSIDLSTKSNKDQNNLFKFLVYDGSKWATIKDFSSTSKINWAPQKAGTYKVKVQVKHKSSKKSFDHEKEITYVVYKKATIDSIQTDKVSPQFSKANILVLAAPSSNKDHLYKFSIYDGTQWKTVQDYSNSADFNWKPSHEGRYTIKVEVKHKLSKEKFDAFMEIEYFIHKPITIQELTPTIREQGAGTALMISAIATGGSELMYKFEVLRDSNWVALQEFSTKNSFEWVTPTEAGDYHIRVLVKDKHSINEFDVLAEQTYTIE